MIPRKKNLLRLLPIVLILAAGALTAGILLRKTTGVTLHIPGESEPGYNLLWQKSLVMLRDAHGAVVKKWPVQTTEGSVADAELLSDGSVLVLLREREGIAQINWDGEITRRLRIDSHHDVEVLRDGAYMAWAQEQLPADGRIAATTSLRSDYLVEVDGEDRIIWRWRLVDHIEELRAAGIALPRASVSPDGDWAHANAVQVLPASAAAARDERFRVGNLLICLRNLDLLAVIDRASGKIVWTFGGGTLEGPHSPLMTPGGEILVFDNGVRRGYSRVVKLDPLRQEVLWTWGDAPEQRFFSSTGGRLQLLPSGNILVSVRNVGEVFELKGDRKVWSFANPESRSVSQGEDLSEAVIVGRDSQGKKVRRIGAEIIRYPVGYVENILASSSP